MFLYDTDGELTGNLSWISRSVTNRPESSTFDMTDDYIDINETWNPPVSQFDLLIIYTLPHIGSRHLYPKVSSPKVPTSRCV